jgi:hypothetical protein
MLRLIGHNGGPPIDVEERPRNPDGRYLLACWKRAHDRAWKSVPHDVMLRRLARAERLGLTYREYTLELLERGRYLQATDTERIAEIIARRKG